MAIHVQSTHTTGIPRHEHANKPADALSISNCYQLLLHAFASAGGELCGRSSRWCSVAISSNFKRRTSIPRLTTPPPPHLSAVSSSACTSDSNWPCLAASAACVVVEVSSPLSIALESPLVSAAVTPQLTVRVVAVAGED